MKDLDWSNLSFGYMPTDYNVRCCYRNGKWGEIEVCSDEYIKLHMAATCLHYGQEAFEGLKAYRCPDGKVRVFRMDENAARLQSTCRGILMPEVPTELFEEMVKKVVRLNQEYIPTYESGATLYIRPLLIGTLYCSRERLRLRVLSRRQGEEIYGRMWCCQFLRNQEQHLRHT